jgi:hypothetical protein
LWRASRTVAEDLDRVRARGAAIPEPVAVAASS